MIYVLIISVKNSRRLRKDIPRNSQKSQRSSKLCQERLERIEACFLLDCESLGGDGESEHEADAARGVQSVLQLLGPHIVVLNFKIPEIFGFLDLGLSLEP